MKRKNFPYKIIKISDIIKKPDSINQYFNDFFINNFNPERLKEVKKNMISFTNHSRSSAIIGFYIDDTLKNTDSKNVVKLYKYTNKTFKLRNDCYLLSTIINEIFINLVITYPYIFNTKINKNDFIKNIKPNINYITEIGNDNEHVYFMTKYLNVYDKNKNINYNNLYDLIKENHIHYLKLMKNQPHFKLILKTYENFMINEIIEPFVTVLKYYQKHFNFVHTDLKLDNIFVKKIKQSKDYQLLKTENIIIDFTPILADFDKSRLNLDKISILPKRRFKNKIVKIFPNIVGIIDDVRYNCLVKFGTDKCQLFNLYDFDILCFMICFNFLLFEIVDDIADYFPKLTSYWMKELKIDIELFILIQKISKKNKGIYFANINNTIRLTCKNKSKNKYKNKYKSKSKSKTKKTQSIK